jgi:hypothetical protein
MSLSTRKQRHLPNHFNHPVAALAQALSASEEEAERRAETRYPTRGDPAELELGSAPSDPVYGTVLDVSRSGLRVVIPGRMNRGEQVKVKLQGNLIFGEVRYCRSVSGAFHVGIRIRELVRPAARQNEHIAAEPLSLYAAGKGLSVPEVMQIREHLVLCETCRARVAKQAALLNPPLKSLD